MSNKYELTDDVWYVEGKILYRIKALKSFNDVNCGDLGGYIESKDNLSQDGDCWVYDLARVYDNARVVEWSEVRGTSLIFEDARVARHSVISGSTKIYGKSELHNAIVSGHAEICTSNVVSGCNIKGNVKIVDNALVDCNCIIEDNVVLYGNSKVCIRGSIKGSVKIGGNSRVLLEDAHLEGCFTISEDATIKSKKGIFMTKTGAIYKTENGLYVEYPSYKGYFKEFKEKVSSGSLDMKSTLVSSQKYFSECLDTKSKRVRLKGNPVVWLFVRLAFLYILGCIILFMPYIHLAVRFMIITMVVSFPGTLIYEKYCSLTDENYEKVEDYKVVICAMLVTAMFVTVYIGTLNLRS